MSLENPILARSYRDKLISAVKTKNEDLEFKVNLEKLIEILEGKKKDYPYIDFWQINRKDLEKEIAIVIKNLSIKGKKEEEKKKRKKFKNYLRSLKKI